MVGRVCCLQNVGALNRELEATLAILGDFSAAEQLAALTHLLTFLQTLTTVHHTGHITSHTPFL